MLGFFFQIIGSKQNGWPVMEHLVARSAVAANMRYTLGKALEKTTIFLSHKVAKAIER